MGTSKDKTTYIVVDTGRQYPMGTIIWANGFRTVPRNGEFFLENNGGVSTKLSPGSPYIKTPAEIPGWQPYTGA
jgi:hypothetical protein